MARRLCDQLGIWDELSAKGIVDADPYVKENDELRFKNLGLPMNFSWQVSSAIAESLCKIFKLKTAIEWEKELSSKGVVGMFSKFSNILYVDRYLFVASNKPPRLVRNFCPEIFRTN